jgi:RNA polymerase sigma-70 factor, ECF subfamily
MPKLEYIGGFLQRTYEYFDTSVTFRTLICPTAKSEALSMINEPDYNDAVKNYARNIFRFVFKNLRDKDASDDVVQDCFLKLWQNRAVVDKQKVRSWLFSVAHHAMINYAKAEARKTGLENAGAVLTASRSTPEFDLKEILEKSLQELPPLQRSIILLRDYEGYNYREIGDILKLGESQVKVYLFRARQRIKDSIKTLSAVL